MLKAPQSSFSIPSWNFFHNHSKNIILQLRFSNKNWIIPKYYSPFYIFSKIFNVEILAILR